MDWREFIASLVGSLAWPAVVVIAVFLLREQIKALLREPVSRLAVGPFEMEWDRTIEATRRELPPVEHPTRRDGGEELPPGGIVADLWPLTETAPTAAIVEGYARIEGALVRRLSGVMEDVPRQSAKHLARLARDKDLITDETVRAIDGLSVLRDLASHGRGEQITSAEAAEYLGLVEAVLHAIVTWIKPDEP